MVAVAAIAIGLSYQKHWSHYQRLAKDQRKLLMCGGAEPKDPVAQEREVRYYRYHDALRRKYELASWMPWLAVAPDPSPLD
jgi:hypothetical protein